MEEKDLIYRAENSEDLREKLIYPTNSGKKLVPWLKDEMDKWEHNFFRVLTKEEIEMYNIITRKLINNLFKVI